MRNNRALGAALAALVLATACGSHAVDGPSRIRTAAACGAAAPPLGLPPRAGPATELVPRGPVSASVCQYDTNVPANKLRDMPRRIVLSGTAAAGLAAVIDSAEPVTPAAKPCDRPVHVLPFSQEIVFSYPTGAARTVTVAFTDCDLAMIAASGRAGQLPFQVDADLFAYTSITTERDGSAPAPDLIGLSGTAIVARARRSHFTVNFGGAVIDEAVPSGTVVFQSLPAGARDSGPGGDVDVILATGRAPDCTASQLALTYLGGGAGAGSDFGTVLVRDTSARPCTLTGPLLVTGLGADGRADTTTIRGSVSGVSVLTPHAGPIRWRPPGTLAGTRPGELTDELDLISAYRDGPANVDNGLCTPLWVVPATWRVTFPGGHALTVANADPADQLKLAGSGGLVTCRGRLGLAQAASVGAP